MGISQGEVAGPLAAQGAGMKDLICGLSSFANCSAAKGMLK